MNKTLIVLMVLFMVSSFMACGSKDEPAPEPGPKWNLLEDDGNGVIFTSYEEKGAVAAQVKFYDNELRKILNNETFEGSMGSSDFELSTISARIYIFGLKYGNATIDKIICDYETGNNQQLQLSFACYYNPDDLDEIIETYDDSRVFWKHPTLRPCDFAGFTSPYYAPPSPFTGIPWQKLVHMAKVPIKDDKTLYCKGGNKTFYVNIFKELGIKTDEFTLFFDFMQDTFRGKMVITEIGEDQENGTVLMFKGLDITPVTE